MRSNAARVTRACVKVPLDIGRASTDPAPIMAERCPTFRPPDTSSLTASSCGPGPADGIIAGSIGAAGGGACPAGEKGASCLPERSAEGARVRCFGGDSVATLRGLLSRLPQESLRQGGGGEMVFSLKWLGLASARNTLPPAIDVLVGHRCDTIALCVLELAG